MTGSEQLLSSPFSSSLSHKSASCHDSRWIDQQATMKADGCCHTASNQFLLLACAAREHSAASGVHQN